MNTIELEPTRIHTLQTWWLKPEAQELLTCLENCAKKAIHEYAELSVKANMELGNESFRAAASEKLTEATEFERAVKVLKNFFPDGPFIARIEL